VGAEALITMMVVVPSIFCLTMALALATVVFWRQSRSLERDCWLILQRSNPSICAVVVVAVVDVVIIFVFMRRRWKTPLVIGNLFCNRSCHPPATVLMVVRH